MKYLDLKTKLKDFVVFSLADIKNYDPNFHRRRLDEWQKKGYIQMIRRGYYRFKDLSLDDHHLYLIANKIYSPSYISLESALSYYHLIPESVYTITSVSTAKTNSFTTPIAKFSYRHLKPNLLFGTTLNPAHNRQVLIGEPEKIILDYLYLNPEYNTPDKIAGLRLNHDNFKQLNWSKIQAYLKKFGSQALRHRLNLLTTNFN